MSLLQRLKLGPEINDGLIGGWVTQATKSQMFTGRLQRGATSISFPVFTARLNVSHRYPAAWKDSSGIRPVFAYFLFFPGHSRVKSLNVTNFLWFMIVTSLRIASCVDAA